MNVLVGSTSFRGNIRRFGFDLLELPVSPTLPRPRTLRDYRAERPDLAISLRVAPDVALAGLTHPDVERTRSAALAAGARVIVVPTPPRFSPAPSHRARLAEFARAFGETGALVAWEPRGVWAKAEAHALAAEHGLLLVGDLTREEAAPGPVVYTRLLPLGFGARVSQSAVDRIAERVEGAETAYVVIQGDGAKIARQRLRALLGLDGAPAQKGWDAYGDDDDDADEDGDADDEDFADEDFDGEAGDDDGSGEEGA